MNIALKIDLSESTNGARTEEGVLATIDFSDWYFYPEQDDDFNRAVEKLIRKTAAEAVRNVLQSDPPAVGFEIDGASVMVDINFGSSWNDGRIWFIASIDEMIDDYLWCTNPNDMDGGDEARTELAKTLRDCAAKLEAAVGRNVERKTSPGERQPAWATELAQEMIADVEEELRQAIEGTDKNGTPEPANP
jgi:hypothetical protein